MLIKYSLVYPAGGPEQSYREVYQDVDKSQPRIYCRWTMMVTTKAFSFQ